MNRKEGSALKHTQVRTGVIITKTKVTATAGQTHQFQFQFQLVPVPVGDLLTQSESESEGGSSTEAGRETVKDSVRKHLASGFFNLII